MEGENQGPINIKNYYKDRMLLPQDGQTDQRVQAESYLFFYHIWKLDF
jgi:hypothetical protein